MEDRPVTPTLLTINEAASYLAMSRKGIERLVSSGRIPQIVLAPKTKRYRREDLDAYIAASAVTR